MSVEEELCEHIEIRTLFGLKEVLKNLKEFVDSGKLKEITMGHFTLARILETDGVPSFVELRFKTVPGNTTYQLTCECDRGLGGAFYKVA